MTTPPASAVSARRTSIGQAIDRAQAWLEAHRTALLPDAIVFWRLAADVTRRRTGAARWRPQGSWSSLATCGFRLSPDYLTVARRMTALLPRLPLAPIRVEWQGDVRPASSGLVRHGTWRDPDHHGKWNGPARHDTWSDPARHGTRNDPVRRGRNEHVRRHGHRPPASAADGQLAASIAVDVRLINRALAEAASGVLSSRTERWCRAPGSSTGYALSHKLLALALRAAARGDAGLHRRDAPIARQVLAELYGELGVAYVDLTAQRLACLALAGCPSGILRPGLRWLTRRQRRAGDWDYFETEANAYETVERVHAGRSPLLRPPLWSRRRDPLLHASAIDLAHRGHATAVAACALACAGGIRRSRG